MKRKDLSLYINNSKKEKKKGKVKWRYLLAMLSMGVSACLTFLKGFWVLQKSVASFLLWGQSKMSPLKDRVGLLLFTFACLLVFVPSFVRSKMGDMPSLCREGRPRRQRPKQNRTSHKSQTNFLSTLYSYFLQGILCFKMYKTRSWISSPQSLFRFAGREYFASVVACWRQESRNASKTTKWCGGKFKQKPSLASRDLASLLHSLIHSQVSLCTGVSLRHSRGWEVSILMQSILSPFSIWWVI